MPAGCGDQGVFTGAEAILAPILDKRIGRGDVVLLEMQTDRSFSPCETSLDVLVAIWLAVQSGIVVVEPDGNNGSDLAQIWSYTLVKKADGSVGELGAHLDPSQGEHYIDSGAVMVGACYQEGSSGPLYRTGSSNYGARLDVYGPGLRLYTADSASTSAVREDFAGTSGASALIAGVCAAVQSSLASRTPPPADRLRPAELRDALSDTTGASTVLNGSDVVGHVPHAGRIVGRLIP
jgi:hypothetical protein